MKPKYGAQSNIPKEAFAYANAIVERDLAPALLGKMKPKLTPWFPASMHPVRDGVYRVWTPDDTTRKLYSYYEDGVFSVTRSAKEAAFADRRYNSYTMTLPGAKWRGRTEP